MGNWGAELGYSPVARIPTLAAYERARRALRGVCEPNPCGARSWARDEVPQTKEKTDLKGRFFLLAAELGFEPRHTESESAVLPLHNSAIALTLVYFSTKDFICQ